MGQALAQMPQAMHLLVAAPPSTMMWKGQASRHAPQLVHFRRSTV